jgi:hypothetical protein
MASSLVAAWLFAWRRNIALLLLGRRLFLVTCHEA